jgi:hypothetical protein
MDIFENRDCINHVPHCFVEKASSLLPLSRTRWNSLDTGNNFKLSTAVSEDAIPAPQQGHDSHRLNRPATPLPPSHSHSNPISAYYTTGGMYEPPVWMMVNYAISTLGNPTRGATELQIINLIYDLFNDIAVIPFSNAIIHEYLHGHTTDARGLIYKSPDNDDNDDHKTIGDVYFNNNSNNSTNQQEDVWIFKQGNISPVLVKGYTCFKQWAHIEITKHREKERGVEVNTFGISDVSSDEECSDEEEKEKEK